MLFGLQKYNNSSYLFACDYISLQVTELRITSLSVLGSGYNVL